MIEGEKTIQAQNFHAAWLEKINEIINKIEETELLAKNGCQDILDYTFALREDKDKYLGLVQYQNVKFLVDYFDILIAKLAPILEDKMNKYITALNAVKENCKEEDLFILRVHNAQHQLVRITPKHFMQVTLDFLSNLKIKLYMEIKDLIFISKGEDW